MSLTDIFPISGQPTQGKLGRSGVAKDPRTLKLADYTSQSLTPPKESHHSHAVRNWGMLANDQLGDCVPAGALHSDELFNAVVKNTVPQYQDSDAITLYEAVGGYVPGDTSTDNGCMLLDMLNYWKTTGLPTTGSRLGAFASVDPTNADQVKRSIWEFGVTYIGLALPVSAQTQRRWTIPKGGPTGDGEPGSWGGHCVAVASYDSKYLALLTWGTVILCTWSFLGTYCDEAYAILSQDQLKNGISNLGFNYVQLQQDLAAI